jgi:hypothetical protein
MRAFPGSLILLLAVVPPALGAPPAPLANSVYDFPGVFASPPSAVSGALGMSDAWLGDEPFDNPAVLPGRAVRATPLLYHMSRQDLRGGNRAVSEQSAFFDGAGVWVGAHVGLVGMFAYGNQPGLRLEQNAYLAGPLGGSVPVENSATVREIRGGIGISTAWRRVRLGIAGEWTQRNDDYTTTDKSGLPSSGTSEVSFSGGALGGQAGARVELGPATGPGRITLGAALRWVPELKVDGTQTSDLQTGSSSSSVSATRASGVEAGMSARYAPTAQVRLTGGVGLHTTQEWQGFGVTRGGGTRWGLGLEFHDAQDPWTVRLGFGQETQRGTPEPRAGDVGIGMGWLIDTTVLDVTIARRTFAHLGGATSYEDRALAEVTVPF